MNRYLSSQGFLTLLILMAWLAAVTCGGCSAKQAYRKSYNLGQVYVVYTGQEMFHFSRAEVQELDPGIQPVNRILDYNRVRYLGRTHNQIAFEYHRQIQNGRTLNFRKRLTLPLRPGEQDIPVDLAGFHLHIFNATTQRIRFQVVAELAALTEEETEALHLLRRFNDGVVSVDPNQQRWAEQEAEQQRRNRRRRDDLPY